MILRKQDSHRLALSSNVTTKLEQILRNIHLSIYGESARPSYAFIPPLGKIYWSHEEMNLQQFKGHH